MAQIFHRSTNSLSRFSIFGAVFFLAILLWLFYDLEASPYTTQQTIVREQPIQFSHAHHVGAVGIDCRYCHTSVEKAAFAGIPPTKTCMNCHSQIWAQSPYLEPVRETCHGRVDQMPLMYQASSLQMKWCLECHRHPERYLRPKEEVFTMGWRPPIEQTVLGERLKREYDIRDDIVLTSCSTCH